MAPLNRIVTTGSYLLIGGAGIVAILSATNAVALVNTPGRALVGSGIIVTIWSAAELLIKQGALRWSSETGDVHLRRLGKRPRFVAIGAISILWLHPVLNLFQPPVEVSTLPHVLYDYASNYPDKYFRFKKVRYDLADDLFSNLSFYNKSDFLMENVEIKIYGFCTSRDNTKFMKPYYLDDSSYVLIGSKRYKRIEGKKKITIDLLEPLKEVFKTEDKLKEILLPELGKETILPKLSCNKPKPTPLFTDDEKLLQEIFIYNIFSNKDMVREADFGFNGAMLKITLEYDVNNITFKHLLAGGMFYKYVIRPENPPSHSDFPVGIAVSGFFKANNSQWKKKDAESFTQISIPQYIVDTVEEGRLQSYVKGSFQPEDEIWVRMAPGALTSPAGELLPLPMYLYVENNIRTPQR